MNHGVRLVACLLGGAVVASPALAQLRIATWNVTNYSGGRYADFQTAIYAEFEGRSLSPDVLIVQEMLSQSGTDQFEQIILNGAPGSPGDWAAAPFLNGPDTDNAFFFRTSRVEFLGVTTIAHGGPAPNHPRNVERYDFRIKGYAGAEAVIACYSSHMKAGQGSDDKQRRLLEAQRIRDDAESLDPAWSFLLGGDFNIQSSGQSAYVEMTGAQANDAGRLFDPILTPGSWNNNSSYRFVHTQDPSGAGGMDDRHDQILVSGSLLDGVGVDYIGSPFVPYSTLTWNDTNHSYRSWGNDGSTYNQAIRVIGNEMVGETIAQALKNSALSGGHLPVFLDVRVPAKIGADGVIDFGEVETGAAAEKDLTVFNAGDVALWSAEGIEDLEYEVMPAPAGFSVTPGVFTEGAGGGVNSHLVAMDTSSPGELSGVLTILSNDIDEPSLEVTLTGRVVAPACDGDANGDGAVSAADVAFVIFRLGDTGAAGNVEGDVDGDGLVTVSDVSYVIFRFDSCG